jgi:hypothetical protein
MEKKLTKKSNAFYFIKNLDDTSVEAKFLYFNLGYLQDMVQSIDFITNTYARK